MMTDPLTILSAAGVSVPEVEEYREATSDYNRDADRRVLNYGVSGAFHVMDSADAAIIALAREVAKMAAEHRQAVQALGWIAGQFALRVRADGFEHGVAMTDDECATMADDFIAEALARYAKDADHE